jgi:hypothetical protein
VVKGDCGPCGGVSDTRRPRPAATPRYEGLNTFTDGREADLRDLRASSLPTSLWIEQRIANDDLVHAV